MHADKLETGRRERHWRVLNRLDIAINGYLSRWPTCHLMLHLWINTFCQHEKQAHILVRCKHDVCC